MIKKKIGEASALSPNMSEGSVSSHDGGFVHGVEAAAKIGGGNLPCPASREHREECTQTETCEAEAPAPEVADSVETLLTSNAYMKNVIFQFLSSPDHLRVKMIPAIVTVLGFSRDEKDAIAYANPYSPPLK